jgi:hypothetical protein
MTLTQPGKAVNGQIPQEASCTRAAAIPLPEETFLLAGNQVARKSLSLPHHPGWQPRALRWPAEAARAEGTPRTRTGRWINRAKRIHSAWPLHSPRGGPVLRLPGEPVGSAWSALGRQRKCGLVQMPVVVVAVGSVSSPLRGSEPWTGRVKVSEAPNATSRNGVSYQFRGRYV